MCERAKFDTGFFVPDRESTFFGGRRRGEEREEGNKLTFLTRTVSDLPQKSKCKLFFEKYVVSTVFCC